MKKVILLLFVFILPIIVFSQDYGEYSFPHTDNFEIYHKYIGQKVKVFNYKGYPGIYSNADYEEKAFERQNGKCDSLYKIEDIMIFRGMIVFTLIDKNGVTINPKVNINGISDNKHLKSCKSFFLVDKFNTDQKIKKGTIIQNKIGTDVAIIEGFEMLYKGEGYPELYYAMKSLLNNKTFYCLPTEVEDYCSEIGTILTNPKVKTSYRIDGIETIFPTSQYDSSIKKSYYVTNSITGEIETCPMSEIENIFSADLRGKYFSYLSMVEKPLNPEIRYGKTSTIVSENNESKFLYRDNVIEIIIFPTSSKFYFELKNISENSIKIIWDEAAFVGLDGCSEKVMHKGIKFSEKNGSQPPTTIIKNAKLDDVIIPTHLVYYKTVDLSDESKLLFQKYGYGDLVEDGWDTHSMYPEQPGLKFGQIRLMLPIQIKNVVNEYIFVFDVEYKYNYPERINDI